MRVPKKALNVDSITLFVLREIISKVYAAVCISPFTYVQNGPKIAPFTISRWSSCMRLGSVSGST